MEQTGNAPPTLTYDQIKQDPDFPQTRDALMKEMFKGWRVQFKCHFPQNILIPLGIFILYWLTHIIFLCFLNGTTFISNENRGLTDGSWLAYLFCGAVTPGVKGFSASTSAAPGAYQANWLYVTFLLLALSFFVGGVISRIRAKGWSAPFKDFAKIPGYAAGYAKKAQTPFTSHLWRGLFIAFASGFFIKNPIAIILFAFYFLHLFGMGTENPPARFFFLWRVTGNLKKENPPSISFADSALPILGLGVGCLAYFAVALATWNLFDYGLWPRMLFSFIPALLFFYFSLMGSDQKARKVLQTAACLLLAFGVFSILGSDKLMQPSTNYADGGWRGELDNWWKSSGLTLFNNWILLSFFTFWIGKMVFDSITKFPVKMSSYNPGILDIPNIGFDAANVPTGHENLL